MNRLHASLPIIVKKHVWNTKYGFLGYPQLVAPADVLQYLAGSLPGTGALLELGCGRGSLIRGLRQSGWSGYYCGVDISKQAIRNAWAAADQRSSWVVSDIEAFSSPFKWDSIAMIESMNYVRLSALPAVVNRLVGMLNKGGSFIARLHDIKKHSGYVHTLQELYPAIKQLSDSLFCIADDTPRSAEPPI
jgi:predicted TPR repeat methyltransferase